MSVYDTSNAFNITKSLSVRHCNTHVNRTHTRTRYRVYCPSSCNRLDYTTVVHTVRTCSGYSAGSGHGFTRAKSVGEREEEQRDFKLKRNRKKKLNISRQRYRIKKTHRFALRSRIPRRRRRTLNAYTTVRSPCPSAATSAGPRCVGELEAPV